MFKNLYMMCGLSKLQRGHLLADSAGMVAVTGVPCPRDSTPGIRPLGLDSTSQAHGHVPRPLRASNHTLGNSLPGGALGKRGKTLKALV